MESMSSELQEALGHIHQQTQGASTMSVHAQMLNAENIAMRNVADQLQAIMLAPQNESANILEVTLQERERQLNSEQYQLRLIHG